MGNKNVFQNKWPLLNEADAQQLNHLKKSVKKDHDQFLGYPCSIEFDYTPLFEFLNHPLNNVGDPYRASTFSLNTHEFERDVLDHFATLLNAPADKVWGYVTNGGTESNMYGIYLARELYPEGMVYYSEDTHYSVGKILRILHARNIMIKSQSTGEIDYDDLRETMRIYRDVPPIIFANIGTTMKGAVDNIATIQNILADLAIHSYYIHADAALSGMILPFVASPPAFDFAAGIDSIAISGHKMIGSPIPCGIALAKKQHVDRIARSVEYIGTLDTTLSGSRNGITPLFLWYALHTKGVTGFKEIVNRCIENARYAVCQLQAAGIDAWRNPNSITVIFPRPNPDIISKWQLAVERNIAHLITMPHVTRDKIDQFVESILTSNTQAKERGQ